MEMSDGSKGIKRKYFVAFDYWTISGIHGVASRAIEVALPISDWDDILSITNYILSCNPDMEKIVIFNWRKFEDPE
jgi:hypothetical protein